MAQSEPNLRDYWWIIRRRKWLVLTAPLLLSVVAYVTGELQAPAPLYRATAVARFERSFNVNTLLLRDIIAVSPVGDLETNAALVKSFPVLSRAARKLDLVPRTATDDEIRASAAHQAVIQSLGAQIEVTRTERTSLLEITATAADPGAAAQIANRVFQAFQDNDIETRTHQIVEARRFIETQLADVGRRLRESEERLRRFQETNKTWLFQEEARTAIARLAEQEAERERVERDIRATQIQMRQLSEENAGADPAALGRGEYDPNVKKLEASLSELTLEREALLLTLRPIHPQVRSLDARIDSLRRELGSVVSENRTRQLRALSSQLQVLGARSTQAARVIAELNSKAATMPAVALEAGRIERDVKVNERIFSLLKERLQELLIKEKEQGAEVTLVRPAIASRVPVNGPQPTHRVLAGLVLGVFIGLVLAFVVEALDTSIGAIHDLESLLETPILAVIPHLDPAALAVEAGEAPPSPERAEETYERFAFLPTVFAPRSPIAEAFRGLRTNLLLRVLDRDVKTLIVTSTAQDEGKTTIAINLAVALAQLGKKTLLVEGDLRNPSIRDVFGIRRHPGVTDVVLGSVRLDGATLNFADLMLGKAGMEHLLDLPGSDNFFLLPSGLRAPNPAELMGSRGFTELLAEARQRYDYVVLDSAPVLSVADASILASQVDGILCVARVGRVPRAALRRAKGMLDGTKTPLLGVCLNGVRAEVSPDYHELTHYKYEYGPRPTKTTAGARLGKLWNAQAWNPRKLVRAGLGLLAVVLGLWGISRVATLLTAPGPSAASLERPAAPPEREAPASSPAPAPAAAPRARELYSVGLPVDGDALGQVSIGQFATRAEATAFGEGLVREGVIPAFRVVPAGAP